MKKLFYTVNFIFLFFSIRGQVIITNPAELPDLSTLSAKPNIILILADDMSYNSLIPDGGPSFLTTPNINRIADEGIRFKNSFVTFSLCEPSRAQLLTGYYAHTTGVITGGTKYDIPSKFTTLPQIMKANGYRTGLVGKYQLGYTNIPRPGWDYWFSFVGGIASDTNAGYFNTNCNLNGVDTNISYHMTDAIAHFAADFLNTNPANQPFFLIISEAAPHKPYEPQTQFNTLYQSVTVPFASTFYEYPVNYPSYLYPDFESTGDSLAMVYHKKKYFELTRGMDTTAKIVFDYLSAQSLLDSTMIIFTSDNGIFFGEHRLKDKMLQYEESIRVPLYIRYPGWFPNPTVDTTHLALNLDIFNTILDAAGAVDTFNTHGFSLRLLAADSVSRNLFMYERIPTVNSKYPPNIRAVRSMQYKYVKSYCASTVEEFFDLGIDPAEKINKIFNPAYTSIINGFRYSLDSIRLALNDTAVIPLASSCFLENIYTGIIDTDTVNIKNLNNIFINYKDPLNLTLFFYFNVPANAYYSLYDISGKVIVNNQQFKLDDRNALTIPINDLATGMYFIKIEIRKKLKTLKFLKMPH